MKFLLFPFLFASSLAHAGYTSLTPPSGFTAAIGSDFATLVAKPVDIFNLGNGSQFVKTQGAINLGGKNLGVNAVARVATGPGGFASKLARVAFAHPALFAAGVIGAAVYDYYQSNNFYVKDGVWVTEIEGESCASNCFEYNIYAVAQGVPVASGWQKSMQSAITKWVSKANSVQTVASYSGPYVKQVYSSSWAGYVSFVRRPDGSSIATNAQIGLFDSRSIPPYDYSTTRPVTEQEMVDKMQNDPVPKDVVDQFPSTLLPSVPITNIIINPDSQLKPSVLVIPQGSPQPVPNTNPQQYKSPVINIVPFSSPDNPWRVDLQPKDVITEDPNPLPDPDPDPDPVTPDPDADPDPADPVNPDPNNGEPSEADLCEKHPDIPACKDFCLTHPESSICQKLGTLDPVDITNEDRSVVFSPDDRWLSGHVAGCPADKTATIMGVQVAMSYAPLCNFATGINPLVVGFAYLSAMLTFFGFARSNS